MQCNFHPTELSIAICDRCNRPICGRNNCLHELSVNKDPFYNEHISTDLEYLVEKGDEFFSPKTNFENFSYEDMSETINYCFLCLFQIKHNQYSKFNKSNGQIIKNFLLYVPVAIIFAGIFLIIFTNIVFTLNSDQLVFIPVTLLFLVLLLFVIFGPVYFQIKERNKNIPRIESIEESYFKFFNVTQIENIGIQCVRCHTSIKAEESLCPNLECDMYENGIKKENSTKENIPSVADVSSSLFGGKSRIKRDFFKPENRD
ncbi:MAG: hypothetical protein ACW967_03565 [Candidatus Hodarchaeales archaeon]|jgi:uncharacterized protein (UPF0333 family)